MVGFGEVWGCDRTGGYGEIGCYSGYRLFYGLAPYSEPF